MGTIYAKKDIISMCEIASKDMKSFYKQNFVNYSGQAKEKEYYTEIIAEWILNNLNKFEEIKQIERHNSYNRNHAGENKVKTSRVEEWTAKQLFKQIDGGVLGTIIDYQTPLKNSQKDEGVGKIDLLSKNTTNKCVYILELKKEESDETMLRTVLEAYTYLKQVSKDKLYKDFEIESDYELLAAPLVYENSRPYKEYKDSERKFLHLLMKKMNIRPFFLEEEIKYVVSNDEP